MADKAEKDNANTGAADTPIVDQHKLNHENRGVFCGIASMLMVLKANGKDPPAETRAQVQQMAEGIYYSGAGTDGSGMAHRLREYGITNAQFTPKGKVSQAVVTLDKGQPVPLGVLHVEGTVVEFGSGGSKRYPHRRVGDQHYRDFRPSGHWVVIVDYEGDRENPSSFLVNDPDLGGKLRISPRAIESMATGDGNMFLVTQ